MDEESRIKRFLREVVSSSGYRGQIVHIAELPPRTPEFQDPASTISPAVSASLSSLGIETLYSHQARAIDLISEGKNVAVVTSTASGKTLCYTIPVLQTLLTDPDSTALYIFPTKALAQDQLRALGDIALRLPRQERPIRPGTYDGDTPQYARRKLRHEANVIMTNPDMLNQGILPYHSRWSRFFSNLKYVVVDEMHTYRGIFGSNVANVLRRLRRIVKHYDADPVFILCSATIANPKELAEKLIGSAVEVVDRDGSPGGPKHFVLWNPPYLELQCRSA